MMNSPLFQSYGFIVTAFILNGCHLFGFPSSDSFEDRQALLERAKGVPYAEVGELPVKENPNAAIGLPKSATPMPEVVVSRQQYVLSWNPLRRGLNWAMWRLRREDIGQGRSGKWLTDPALESYLKQFNLPAVGYEEFKGSCFDRGHVVPSGDRNSSIEYNVPTFYLSNVLPQTSYSNRVVWNHLEMQERELITDRRPELFIVSGPLYEEDWGGIGSDESIKVPTAFFKVILSKQVGQDPGVQNSELPVAVIVPNILSTGASPKADHEKLCEEFGDQNLGQGEVLKDDWKKYITTIAEVERRTGLDIPDVADTVQLQP